MIDVGDQIRVHSYEEPAEKLYYNCSRPVRFRMNAAFASIYESATDVRWAVISELKSGIEEP